jgi:hypothetical protein
MQPNGEVGNHSGAAIAAAREAGLEQAGTASSSTSHSCRIGVVSCICGAQLIYQHFEPMKCCDMRHSLRQCQVEGSEAVHVKCKQ